MFTELTEELLDLTSAEKGRTRAQYAMNISICSCSCCVCVLFC